eukprot:scaffold34424_cov75-Phaeocystis_antarctica.AAC.2
MLELVLLRMVAVPVHEQRHAPLYGLVDVKYPRVPPLGGWAVVIARPDAREVQPAISHHTVPRLLAQRGGEGYDTDLAICNQVALGRPQRSFITAGEEVARDAVEVKEVAKASLDHGEQMLAIARQKAPRLASIERCKLLRQQPPCIRLVIVRVGNEIDLYALLVAAHWHTHEQRLRGAREPFNHRGGGSNGAGVRGPSHDEQHLAAREEDGQAGERLLDVALVDARLVLRRKARRAYVPSMHAVGRAHESARGATSQSVGSLPVISSRRFAQRDTTACLAPGASFSSFQEWLRKAVTCPIAAGSVRSWSVGPADGAVVLLARSAACSRLAGRHRRSFEARSSAASGSLPPTSAATAAASSAAVPRPPRRPRRWWRRPRLRGVARAAHSRKATLEAAAAQ